MGYEEVLALLFREGAHARPKIREAERPSIKLASRYRSLHLGVVKMLLQHMVGQELDERNDLGWTALHCAAHSDHEECSSLFKVRAVPNLGREPLRETLRSVPTKS
jgi:ankyrin repeat protein